MSPNILILSFKFFLSSLGTPRISAIVISRIGMEAIKLNRRDPKLCKSFVHNSIQFGSSPRVKVTRAGAGGRRETELARAITARRPLSPKLSYRDYANLNPQLTFIPRCSVSSISQWFHCKSS